MFLFLAASPIKLIYCGVKCYIGPWYCMGGLIYVFALFNAQTGPGLLNISLVQGLEVEGGRKPQTKEEEYTLPYLQNRAR